LLEENPSEADLTHAFTGTVCEAAIGQPLAQAGDLIAHAFTTRGETRDRTTPPLPHQMPRCTLYALEISNYEPDDLYQTILGIASSGEIAVLFPNAWSNFERDQIAGNTTIQLPDPALQDNFSFFLNEPGIGEILIIASRSPLSRARASLQSLYQINMKLRQTRGVPFEVIGNDRTSFSGDGDREPGAVREIVAPCS
jgi:hypothetical protein